MARAQFNLLPDIKQANIKTTRLINLINSGAITAAAVSLSIFVVMLVTVAGLQKKQLSDANGQIAQYTNELKGNGSLEKILTVQNQLTTLADLHKNKHISSRIFTYLPEVTPTSVSLGNLSLDLTNNTMQITGNADSQKSVNTFIDTLKFTTYTINEGSEKTAFPSVIESSFGIAANAASFTLSVTFDPVLFTNSNLDDQGNPVVPTLKVPKLTSTRSVVDDPANVLFNGQNAEGGR